MAKFSKDLQALSVLAAEQGWVIRIGNNHAKWYPPEDAPNRPTSGFITTSVTPSDSSIIPTIVSQLENCGLIADRSAWKRAKKEALAKENGGELDSKREAAGLAVDDSEIAAGILGVFGDTITPRVLAATVRAYKEYGSYFTGCTCGESYDVPAKLLRHIGTWHLREDYDHQPITSRQARELAARRVALESTQAGPETSAGVDHADPENGPENAVESEVRSELIERVRRMLEMANIERSLVEKQLVTVDDRIRELQELLIAL